MRRTALMFVALASLLVAPAALAEAAVTSSGGATVAPIAEDCFNCSKGDSTDDCKGFDQCRGTREHCRKIGCKIVGTGSCSTSANVKICEWDGSSIDLERAEAAELLAHTPVAPVAEDCFNCSKGDSTDDCKGFDQCRGTREHCRKIGCKIVGTGSCSTSANVKICEWDGSSIEAEAAEFDRVEALSVGMCTP